MPGPAASRPPPKRRGAVAVHEVRDEKTGSRCFQSDNHRLSWKFTYANGKHCARERSMTPLDILDAARKAVPAVNYALGVAGIAAAGALIVGFLGKGRAAIIILAGIFVAMFLLVVFASAVGAEGNSATTAGTVIQWAVTIFFCFFLAFSATAVAFGWPVALTSVLGLSNSVVPAASRDYVVGRWYAYQTNGEYKASSTISYRDDGTCAADIETFLNDDTGIKRTFRGAWEFKKISDKSFLLTTKYPDHPELTVTDEEFRVIDQNRAENVRLGAPSMRLP